MSIYDEYGAVLHFEGDVIITDPCYLMKNQDIKGKPLWSDFFDKPSYAGLSEKELKDCNFYENYGKMRLAMEKWGLEHPDDWNVCNYGESMELLGFNTCLVAGTIYGDWSCTTVETKKGKKTKNILGQFCADAGLVGVFLLDEVLKYNPDFDYHTERLWTTTLLKNFNGDISINTNLNREVYVLGTGNINFITYQSGF